ncbi:substrate-binding domain-containing protein [Roseburia faecis]
MFGKYCYPRLTTVYQDVTEKGRTAVKLMIDLLENRLMAVWM